MTTITAIILTHNEAQHLGRCIASLQGVVAQVCVVDSHSTDDTRAIAESLGAKVYVNRWLNYSNQFNWALDNCQIDSEWVMRIDADEYIEPLLAKSISSFVASPSHYNSACFRRKIVFLGQPIRHGFFYPANMLRLWRRGAGRVEQRWMDEHVVVADAQTTTLAGDLTDENLNDLTWWTQKHNGYAMREVYDIIASEATSGSQHKHLAGQAATKRMIKTFLYNRLPPGFRAFLYFFYRYVVGFGFLDGKSGFYFHFLQALWYRVYVDAKLHELRLEAHRCNVTPHELLKRRGIFRS